MILSGTVTVPPNATSVIVFGSFGSTYQVTGLTPVGTGWLPSIEVQAKGSASFTPVFSNPAPAAGGFLDWEVTTPTVQPQPAATCVLAGELLNRVRAKIPDDVFINELPQPDVDGKFRAQTLYRWMDDARQVLTQLSGWTIDDWYAMAQVRLQGWYTVDPKFISAQAGFSNLWPLGMDVVSETDSIWPNSFGPMNSQPLLGFVRRLADTLEMGLFPVPTASDPATTLSSNLAISGVDPIPLVATTGFLTYGYVQIDSEIIQYQQLNTGPVSIGVISRGVCGTSAAAHTAGAAVQHLGFWIKGKRLPTEIVNSQSCIEVPRPWQSHLETYVLAQVRERQGKGAESQRLMTAFERACRDIDADPKWKPRVGQRRMYGYPAVGPLYGRSPFGTVVP